ncbi:MAG TPA: FtsX-like permease family protein [Polyangia bacterium]|nr:FtsX-like permease family protein [Polyangia bacterium]
MSFLLLIVKSAFRNRLRTTLTAVGVAIAIVAFLFLRTFISAWYAGVESSSSDRMVVRNKISIIFPLPIAYLDKIKQVPGVEEVTYQNWFGGIYIDEKNFFAQFASDDGLFKLYPEATTPPEQMQAYMNDRTGALVGQHLAEKYGWKIGDTVTLKGAIYPGDWKFTIRGIYTSTSKTFDVSTMFFHWKYFNEAIPERLQNQIGIAIVKIKSGVDSAQVASAIDKTFVNSLAETRTESEKQFQLEFISMASAVIDAIQVVSFVVLIILMLILGNTLAMATRERTTEYAVMRAIGFRPAHVVWLVLGEGFVIAAVGVALGLAMAAPVLKTFAQIFEKQLGAFLGSFDLDPKVIALAVAVALGLGMLASVIPAWRSGRLKIVDALRRIE